MSHTIKLEDRVFAQLENFRDKRETYSQAAERLLAIPGELDGVLSILEGQAKFEEWQRERSQQLTPA